MCYYAEFGRSALKGVGINTGEPPKLGALELRCLGMGDVADSQDTRHSPTCYHVKFGSSAIKVVCINRKEPKKLGSAGTRPLGVKQTASLTPKNKPPSHMCCYVKFGSSVLKGVCINRRETPKLGSAGTPRNAIFSRMCYLPSLVVLGQNVLRRSA